MRICFGIIVLCSVAILYVQYSSLPLQVAQQPKGDSASEDTTSGEFYIYTVFGTLLVHFTRLSCRLLAMQAEQGSVSRSILTEQSNKVISSTVRISDVLVNLGYKHMLFSMRKRSYLRDLESLSPAIWRFSEHGGLGVTLASNVEVL